MHFLASHPNLKWYQQVSKVRRLLGGEFDLFRLLFCEEVLQDGNVGMLWASPNLELAGINFPCPVAAQLTCLAWLFVMLCLLALVYSLALRHLLSCMMWRKRSGFGYFRVFYQLFPILSPSLNLQEVMRVFVLYECGVCPSIVFFNTVSDMVLLPNSVLFISYRWIKESSKNFCA